ncbi:MAG: CD225/dispanin family protein [Prevotella sp.]|nr:CD225/dispanin family protein [Prevotella sp.]
MAFCSNCGSSLKENSLFCPVCGQRVGVVLKVQQQDSFVTSDKFKETKPFKPNNNMTLAILTTCFCCVPFGVYAIVLANKVDTLYYSGEYELAEMAAKDSKKWSIIGILSTFTLYILCFVIGIVLAIMTDGEIFEGL